MNGREKEEGCAFCEAIGLGVDQGVAGDLLWVRGKEVFGEFAFDCVLGLGVLLFEFEISCARFCSWMDGMAWWERNGAGVDRMVEDVM